MILITRPKEQSKDLTVLLNTIGHKVIIESLYKITYHKNKIIYDKNIYYIFPSIHSVNSLVKNKQIYQFKEAKILAVGNKVKQALKDSGCNNVLGFLDSKILFKFLNKSKHKNSKFSYLCSNVINNEFFYKVNLSKINIKKEIVYKTLPRLNLTKKLINLLKLNKIIGATFYSQLSAKTFLRLVSKYKILNLLRNIDIFCISERVATPFRKKKFNFIYISIKPDQVTLVNTIKKTYLN